MNAIGIKKNTYNNFSPPKEEIEFSFCNNFGHEESECRRKLQPTSQKDQTSKNSNVWKRMLLSPK